MRTVEEASNAMTLDGIIFEACTLYWIRFLILHIIGWVKYVVLCYQSALMVSETLCFYCFTLVLICCITFYIYGFAIVNQFFLYLYHVVWPHHLFCLIGCICKSPEAYWLQSFISCSTWSQSTKSKPQFSCCWAYTWVSGVLYNV